IRILWSTILDVGEEVEEGAIFHVTLKRVEVQQAAKEGANWLGVTVLNPQSRKISKFCPA
uniref:Uncharacterized protein n=1 Tax=Athene cunicularia TaxID=194338 RepID=A0A663M4Y3_ATHCN